MVNDISKVEAAARSDDFHENPFTYRADADIQKSLARLAGFEGQRACKVAGGVADAPFADTEDENPDE